ncbi:hypothetical protein [Aquimarina algiphila]|uniref:hypothetical protein n=1 Tax=Aquimarina algiphila TaxID=2047982 RepID=UPI00248FBFBD|nr:hypothetical protein [Aquimarina algiphila]
MIFTDGLNFDSSDSNSLNSISQCDYCGNIFESKNPKKYCSNSCRQRAYYVRNGLRKDVRKNRSSDFLSSAGGRILDFNKSKKATNMDKHPQTGSPKIPAKTKVDSLEQEIKRLEQLVTHSTLKTVALEEMISVAEQYFNITIRKKRGAKQ